MHQLDHVLTPVGNRWSVLQCKTFHSGTGGAQAVREDKILWAPYTDHEPVEVRLKFPAVETTGTERTRENEETPLQVDGREST